MSLINRILEKQKRRVSLTSPKTLGPGPEKLTDTNSIITGSDSVMSEVFTGLTGPAAQEEQPGVFDTVNFPSRSTGEIDQPTPAT